MQKLPQAKADALKAIPGAADLIAAFEDRPGTYLVGGAVRDLLLGFAQFDFDLMVERDAAGAAHQLAERIGGRVIEHERFLTATVRSDDGGLNVDFATARSEQYERPGALPTVSQASVELDLTRRDFTVNAIAMALWGERFGELIEYPGASADLQARLLRVTHDASFIDDPTRLLRLLRYGARLGFTAEPHTEELARSAVEAGAPATVSGARIRDELLDILRERSVVVAIESMAALGLDRALHPEFDADEYVIARAMNLPLEGANQELLLLALCSRAMDQSTLADWLAHLQLAKRDVKRVAQIVEIGSGLLGAAEACAKDELDRLLAETPTEALIFALALPHRSGAASEAIRARLPIAAGV